MHWKSTASCSTTLPPTRPTDMTDYTKLDAWIDAHFDEEVRFLQELVRVPTDTPPDVTSTSTSRRTSTTSLRSASGSSGPIPSERTSAPASR